MDPELVEECLDKLGFDLDYGGYPGAAAYLGYREKGDTSKLSDWMLENCLDLTAEMPVMLTIPSERSSVRGTASCSASFRGERTPALP